MQRFIPRLSGLASLMLLLVGPASGTSLVAEASPDKLAAGQTCGLPQPAFCDTFTTRFPGGGRTGEIDPARWSVSRLSNYLNITQGQVNSWPSSTLPMCDHDVGAVLPPNDVKVCTPDPGEDPYFDEQFDDHGGFL